MRHENRNLDDFFSAIVRFCVDTTYTNEFAAELLVRIACEVFNQEEYISTGQPPKEAEG